VDVGPFAAGPVSLGAFATDGGHEFVDVDAGGLDWFDDVAPPGDRLGGRFLALVVPHPSAGVVPDFYQSG